MAGVTKAYARCQVLRMLDDGRARSARYLRDRVDWRNKVSFYVLLASMEDDGLIRGETRTKDVFGHEIQERWYTLTEKGHEARTEAEA